VALIQVSPPDKHGNCSLGVSVEATLAACEVAPLIIAQINPQMPRWLPCMGMLTWVFIQKCSPTAYCR
jgi:acyl-CoA hydrolase